MIAVRKGRKEVLSELVAYESVSLDIKDIWYLVWNPRTLHPRCGEIIDEATQIRRLKQQRQVSKVLLDGLYDPDSPLFMLLGVRTDVIGDIIWKELVENWKMFSDQQVEQILVMREGNDDDDDDDGDHEEDKDGRRGGRGWCIQS